MTEKEIRNSLDKTEFEKDGWQIIILEYSNKTVRGRYELKKWESGAHEQTKQPLNIYRKNLIEGLTNVLVNTLIPPSIEDTEHTIEELKKEIAKLRNENASLKNKDKDKK